MNLIYQYWNGRIPPIARQSSRNISDYAGRIGAEYLFSHNEPWSRRLTDNPHHYGILGPLCDPQFRGFDRVLFLDSDVFAVDGLEDDVFKEPLGDFAMAEEPAQPELRSVKQSGICLKNDLKWARLMHDRFMSKVPFDAKGRPLVFNTGVVMFSRKFMGDGMDRMIEPRRYVRTVDSAGLPFFYSIDQNYLHAMAFTGKVDFSTLDTSWNSQVHWVRDRAGDYLYDGRGPATKFVHVQLSGSNEWDEDTINRVVNLPRKEWGL